MQNINNPSWVSAHNSLKSRIPLFSPISRPSHVATSNDGKEEHQLEQEPQPASATAAAAAALAVLLLGVLGVTPVPVAAGRSTVGRWRAAADTVQVLRLEGDNVVVVAKLTGLRRETQVSHGGDGDVGVIGMEFKA